MASNNLLYAYYCGRCQSKLKESPVELAASPNDLCPQCGSFLAETLLHRLQNKTWLGQNTTITTTPTILKTAFDLAGPSFGISLLDDLVGKFTASICLTGPCMAETLFWRAIVRSLLPKRAGGSGFSKVLLIDAGNCSDIYLCVDYARQYGLSLDKLLDNIVVTRAFTVYQLAALTSEVGPKATEIGADMVAIADMAKMFVTDPQMQKEEGRLAGKIVDGLIAASKRVPVLAFASSYGLSDWITWFDKIVEVISEQGHVSLLVHSANACRPSLSSSASAASRAVIPETDVFLVAEA